MRPKKIYLNYAKGSKDDEIAFFATWSERPIAGTDCEMVNAEYTDLSQVWHDGDDKPNDGDICLIESPFTYSSGNGFFVAYWLDSRGYFTRVNTMEATYLDQ